MFLQRGSNLSERVSASAPPGHRAGADLIAQKGSRDYFVCMSEKEKCVVHPHLDAISICLVGSYDAFTLTKNGSLSKNYEFAESISHGS